jgi:hypothetical protein
MASPAAQSISGPAVCATVQCVAVAHESVGLNFKISMKPTGRLQLAGEATQALRGFLA